MLDHVSIINGGGIVLWSYSPRRLKGNPVNEFIGKVILEERGGESQVHMDQYTMKWTFANEFDLMLVVIYQKILQLFYIDDLLDTLKSKFVSQYRSSLSSIKEKNAKISEVDFNFDKMFEQILVSVEERDKQRTAERTLKGPRTYQEANKGKDKGNKKGKNENPSEDSPKPSPSKEISEEDMTAEQKIKYNIDKMKQRQNPSPSKTREQNDKPEVKKKAPRLWEGQVAKGVELDHSKPVEPSTTRKQETVSVVTKLDEWSGGYAEEEEKNTKPGRFMSFLNGLTGNKEMQQEDLVPALAEFKTHLVSKNVATDVADKLCDSISLSLRGHKFSTITGVKGIIKTSLEAALIRILTPKKNIDILRDALDAKKQGRPYAVAFVGVNGVGKSTNLAKVCSYLQQNGLSVMLAACDTFRAGAVEQLGVHAGRLNVEIYQKGYRSDPTAIAVDALKYAKSQGIDVVLIDTAGRMQDNEPLMISLSQLINTAKPDLALFVGEALVGNEAVDQLTKFNQALVDYSTDKDPRVIDGIILTKFDTIDDKVGAAISMVYATGAPIVFLGVGQSYADLKRMNVNLVTKALLRGA
eukprot:TRINITY_DN5546_c0_g1_i1.p1 TRINITY_DN5546_c0_g1~~TRINITY_DN5546_c0_g1_i1.p1  ORF type:complete len:592 (+),score=198.60 TRINITY_DN5546_c0_g1_i1:32-1777(+)